MSLHGIVLGKSVSEIEVQVTPSVER